MRALRQCDNERKEAHAHSDLVHLPPTCHAGVQDTLCAHMCRETRALLAAGQDAETQAFVGSNNHPRLWRLLAGHALEHLDFRTAEKGFVHCRDMQGLLLVRHLVKLGVPEKQQAEVRQQDGSKGCACAAKHQQTRTCCNLWGLQGGQGAQRRAGARWHEGFLPAPPVSWSDAKGHCKLHGLTPKGTASCMV
jgi:hypothetical protein